MKEKNIKQLITDNIVIVVQKNQYYNYNIISD